MLVRRLPILLFFLIKPHEAAVSSLPNSKVSADEAKAEATTPQILDLSGHLSQVTLGDKIPKEQSGSTELPKPLLPLFKISEQIDELVRKVSTLNINTGVEMIEKGLDQILDSGACVDDIAPIIGSLPFEAKELALAAIRGKAYTLLKLLQKVYIWQDERHYCWFMTLSYDSPWYDKEMWESPKPASMDWEKNLQFICEMDKGALAKAVRKNVLSGDALVSFDKELLLLCVEYDAINVFKAMEMDPLQLENHLESLTKNSAAKLLRLYQSHTGLPQLHLEKYSFSIKLPSTVDDFRFLLENGYNFFAMERLIKRICEEKRLEFLIPLKELDPELIPNLSLLIRDAEMTFGIYHIG